jgi:endonuclease YncB( thermonuclease family)
MLLWRIPAARAWLAITTTRTTGWTPRPEFDFSASQVNKLWRWHLGVNTDGDQVSKDAFSPDNLIDAAALRDEKAFTELKALEKVSETSYEDIFKHGVLVKNFVAAMNRYNKPGQKGASDIEQELETARKAWDKSVGAFFSMVSSAITGVVGMFRMSLMEMGYGMGMVGSMQQQANILNKAFNDSIYYSIGTPGSLTWLADNPFTREYGEPVIEVREPFQRIHYINSFQDILHNGIIENLNNVPTVITASSDGKYPVTVYFDKGASPEKQFETGVETGLFWDNARGSGFFGFLHPLLHPIETARGLAKSAMGSSDEIMSRRVALWHLKEGLKDIYQGEVLVLGRADIRPFDLIYLADVYERMYGIFEVEAVTHHFTSDTGFVTGIAPNALVSINDPGKWTMQSWVWGMLGVQDTRNHVRHLYSVYADKGAKAFNMDLNPPGTDDEGNVNMNALATAIEPTLRGNIQYTGGNSNLLKDMATHAGTGYLRPGNGGYLTDNEKIVSEIESKINTPSFTFLSMVPGFGKVTDIIWDGWTWVRDNLLDQHGCYIQYLSKNGQPMDSGLSFNQGVAVGYHHSVNLLPGILNLEVKTTQNGHRRITSNDIMSQLGWSEVDIVGVQQNVSWWNNYWNSKVLELSGHGPDPIALSPPTAYLAKVLEVDSENDYNRNGVIDGDTIKALVLDGPKAGKEVRFRFAGINTPELEFKEQPLRNNQSSKAFFARQLVEKRLITDQVSQGFEPIVAIRESTGSGTPGAPTSEDKYGRTLAVIFHNAPGQPQDNDDRNNLLLKAATAWPLTQWDSFLADGRPYTMNWELVMAGLAYTDMGGVARNDPDRGYTSTGRYIGGN